MLELEVAVVGRASCDLVNGVGYGLTHHKAEKQPSALWGDEKRWERGGAEQRSCQHSDFKLMNFLKWKPIEEFLMELRGIDGVGTSMYLYLFVLREK